MMLIRQVSGFINIIIIKYIFGINLGKNDLPTEKYALLFNSIKSKFRFTALI